MQAQDEVTARANGYASAASSSAVHVEVCSEKGATNSGASWQNLLPLVPSLLWFGLMLGAIIWLRNPLRDLVLALVKRIQDGGAIEVGGVKIHGVQTAAHVEQVAKAAAEANDTLTAEKAAGADFPSDAAVAVDGVNNGTPTTPLHTPVPTPTATTTTTTTTIPPTASGEHRAATSTSTELEDQGAGVASAEAPPIVPPEVTPQERKDFQKRYLLMEDLALRAIQEEYGQPVQRQISGPGGYPFDGFFLQGNIPHVVEVKYSSGLHAVDQSLKAVTQVKDALSRNGWQGVRILIVLVVESRRAAFTVHRELAHRSETRVPGVQFRVFVAADLRAQFGFD